MFKTLVEFEVENEKAQGLRGADFLRRAREAQRVRSVILRAGQDPIANGIFDVRLHRLCVVCNDAIAE